LHFFARAPPHFRRYIAAASDFRHYAFRIAPLIRFADTSADFFTPLIAFATPISSFLAYAMIFLRFSYFQIFSFQHYIDISAID
jgi:hypothetical protein